MHPTITQGPRATPSMQRTRDLAVEGLAEKTSAQGSRPATPTGWDGCVRFADCFAPSAWFHQAIALPTVDHALPAPAWAPPARMGATMRGRKGVRRDFDAYPAVVDVPRAPKHLWAVSDIHGDFDHFVDLAASHGVLAQATEAKSWHWAAGDATLVVLGDMIDKGPKNLETLELLQALEGEAKGAGGRVVNLLGNHEVEFINNPNNGKARGPGGICWDLEERNIDPKFFASSKHPTGLWLRQRPFAARVGNWFFAHGGQTSGRSLEGLGAMLEVALKDGGWNDPLVLGPNSIVRARNWYGQDGAKGQENARLLGVGHIVFGHDPDTIDPRGKIVAFPPGQRQLFRIDTGLSRGINYGLGEMLHVTWEKDADHVEACGAHGKTRKLAVERRP